MKRVHIAEEIRRFSLVQIVDENKGLVGILSEAVHRVNIGIACDEKPFGHYVGRRCGSIKDYRFQYNMPGYSVLDYADLHNLRSIGSPALADCKAVLFLLNKRAELFIGQFDCDFRIISVVDIKTRV